jgi:hypothetical protein
MPRWAENPNKVQVRPDKIRDPGDPDGMEPFPFPPRSREFPSCDPSRTRIFPEKWKQMG